MDFGLDELYEIILPRLC